MFLFFNCSCNTYASHDFTKYITVAVVTAIVVYEKIMLIIITHNNIALNSIIAFLKVSIFIILYCCLFLFYNIYLNKKYKKIISLKQKKESTIIADSFK